MNVRRKNGKFVVNERGDCEWIPDPTVPDPEEEIPPAFEPDLLAVTTMHRDFRDSLNDLSKFALPAAGLLTVATSLGYLASLVWQTMRREDIEGV